MKKFIGFAVALAVLAVLPGFAESQVSGGQRSTGVSMHPEDVLALNIFVPEETFNRSFQNAALEDLLLPGIRAGVSLSSAPGLLYSQEKTESWYAKISSAVAAGINFIIGTEKEEARTGSIDFEVFEGAADLMYRIRVSEFPDFIDGELEPQLMVEETVFYINVDGDDDAQDDRRVGGEVQWLFTRNFGLFVEYRFLNPGVDAEEAAGTAITRFETDVSSHSFLGGVSYRF